MRAVKKVIVLLTAVVLGCACLFTVGCGNEELLQKIDSLAGQVGELNDKLETARRLFSRLEAEGKLRSRKKTHRLRKNSENCRRKTKSFLRR